MKNFFDILINIWKIEELRERILLTLFLLAIYRIGAQIVLPGIDPIQLSELADRTGGGGLLGVLNMFTGGAFANASVFALGIMPYISASIVVQLMGIAIPYLQKLQKDGESGRRKINQITRWLTIAICVFQAPAYLYSLGALGVPDSAFILGKGISFIIPSVIILVTGTIFAMWLGEKITDKGVGNGISLLITVGIVATLPMSFAQEFSSRLIGSNGGLIVVLLEVIAWIGINTICILLVMAVRRVPVEYARRTSSTISSIRSAKRQYIPLKLNASGVMPIIFAQALMFAPAALGRLFGENSFGQWLQSSFSDIFGLWYNILFAILIIIFTYFYTAITVPTNKMADDLKRSGGFVPGIRPGTETADFLDRVMSQITFPGSLFLAAVSILPAVVFHLFGMQQGWALFYGGTSLLIMVGVAIDTIQQINAYLLNRHYDGLMKTGVKRKKISI
ncbi:MAG: preprotein translocase subunit SecY [Flavobacteriales bacterium]|nr:preprotein translocase subunit SecY [Flavobacteriales bacterium]